mgnify:CR=1 FL=1
MHHRLVDIPVEHFDKVKSRVQHWIAEAAEGSSYFNERDVWTALEKQEAQLWTAWGENGPDAVCVTQLTPTSKGKFCAIWIMVGSGMVDWLPLIEELEQWAKIEGCTFMRHEARPGWSKILKTKGYHMPHVILEKEI